MVKRAGMSPPYRVNLCLAVLGVKKLIISEFLVAKYDKTRSHLKFHPPDSENSRPVLILNSRADKKKELRVLVQLRTIDQPQTPRQ